MTLEIDRENLKKGVLGLVVALVEIIRDALRTQALRRIEAKNLSDDECERLGRALRDLDIAIDSIKQENGLEDAVRSVREGLDCTVNQVIETFILDDQRFDRDFAKKRSQRTGFAHN